MAHFEKLLFCSGGNLNEIRYLIKNIQKLKNKKNAFLFLLIMAN